MKKIFAIAMIALAAMTTFSSCNKEGGKDKPESKEFKQTARITSFGAVYESGVETFKYTYNDEGKVSQIVCDWAGEIYATIELKYDGNKCEAWDGSYHMWDIELNDMGFAKKFTMYDDNSKVIEYTYTADGFLKEAKINGEKSTEQSITGDECVEWWTKNDEGNWRTKEHTYLTKENVAAIHTEYSEFAGVKRWVYETGLLGRASRYVCATAQWNDRTALAQYDYEFDETTGAILKETKSFGEPGALDFDSQFVFTVEAIK